MPTMKSTRTALVNWPARKSPCRWEPPRIHHSWDSDYWLSNALLLQLPEGGGEFEYAPYLRAEDKENYDGASRLFADPQSLARRPPIGLGDFNVFMGDLSMHRVTPVVGSRPRVVALFSYDRRPGMVFDQSYIDELYEGMPASA